MGLRFRKRIGLGKFLRLNLSGSGVSLGIGPPGLNVNIGRRGVRKTIGLPGTGISYQTVSSWKKSDGTSNTVQPVQQLAPSGSKFRVFVWLVVLGAIVGLIWVISRSNNSPNKSILAVDGTSQQGKTAPPASAPLALGPAPQMTTQPISPAPTIAPANTPSKDSSIAIPGGGAVAASLSMDEVHELQTLLKAAGFDPGPIDGFVGPRTQAAIRIYQQRRNLSVTGLAERGLLERLRKDHAP